MIFLVVVWKTVYEEFLIYLLIIIIFLFLLDKLHFLDFFLLLLRTFWKFFLFLVYYLLLYSLDKLIGVRFVLQFDILVITLHLRAARLTIWLNVWTFLRDFGFGLVFGEIKYIQCYANQIIVALSWFLNTANDDALALTLTQAISAVAMWAFP